MPHAPAAVHYVDAPLGSWLTDGHVHTVVGAEVPVAREDVQHFYGREGSIMKI